MSRSPENRSALRPVSLNSQEQELGRLTKAGSLSLIRLSLLATILMIAAGSSLCFASSGGPYTPVPPDLHKPFIHANEPAAATLSGMGLAGLWYIGRNRRRRFRNKLVGDAGAGGLVIVEPRSASFLAWLDSTGYLALKRLADIVLAALALAALMPLFIVLSVAIYLDSPGPLFYAQTRLGLGRRKFKLLKFRSMCPNADEVLKQNKELMKEFEELFKLKNDPRITRMGHILRKTSLDELPQLVNVLLGHISLVGPRPIVESEVEKYWPFEERLFSVKPGVTGLWQVSGRNDTTYEERVRLDMRYIAERSLIGDISILLRTVPALLGKGTGAY